MLYIRVSISNIYLSFPPRSSRRWERRGVPRQRSPRISNKSHPRCAKSRNSPPMPILRAKRSVSLRIWPKSITSIVQKSRISDCPREIACLSRMFFNIATMKCARSSRGARWSAWSCHAFLTLVASPRRGEAISRPGYRLSRRNTLSSRSGRPGGRDNSAIS